MQRNGVLRGDYRLKIARQNYLTTKQDDMMAYLVAQRARGEVVSACHDAEKLFVRRSSALLQAAALAYQSEHRQLGERLGAVSDIGAGASGDKRTASSGDIIVGRVYALLKVSWELLMCAWRLSPMLRPAPMQTGRLFRMKGECTA